MRILVTGAKGLLGARVLQAAQSRGHEAVGLGREELDVTDGQRVDEAIERLGPEAVVHCAAYTAVDRAEVEPDRAYAVNREGARNVAAAARRVGAVVVQLSTDYVFDGVGHRPYRTDDSTAPRSVYARSKLEGEEAVRAVGGEWAVVRTSWLYGGASGFVPAILRRAARGEALRIVADQRGRPSWAPEVARALLELLERGVRGVWHVAGGGECTWYDLAKQAVAVAGYSVPIEAISSEDFGAPAERPRYSVLDLEATERLLGRAMVDWVTALRQYIRTDWATLEARTA